MNHGVKGKIILTTGGCGDIGRAVTKKLTYHGATVVVCDLWEDAEAKSRLAHLNLPREQWLYFKTDVTDRAKVDAMIEEIYRRYSKLDVACANADSVPRQRAIAVIARIRQQRRIKLTSEELEGNVRR